jgi:hypothetical protein
LKVQNLIPYDIHDQQYSVSQQVLSVFWTLITALILWPAITLLCWDMTAKIDPKKLPDEHLPWLIQKLYEKFDSHLKIQSLRSPEFLRCLFLIVQIIGGPIIIANIERTLTLNDINLSAAPLLGAGQLIALLVGIFSLYITIFSALKEDIETLKKAIKKMGWRRSRGTDVEMSVQDQAPVTHDTSLPQRNNAADGTRKRASTC